MGIFRKVTATGLAALLGACAGTVASGPDAGASLPTAPSAVTATAEIRSANVSWTAPSSDGGSALLGYRVVISPATPSAVVTITGTTASVTELANGGTYSFAVTAFNAVGTGPVSAASNAVTTPDVPGAPSAVVGVAGDSSASLTWAAPAATGGSPVTGYSVAISPATPSAQVVISGTGATVTSLTNGTAYTFTVAATNAVGTGPVSLPSLAITPVAFPPGVPSAPNNVTAAAAAGGATVSWSAPSSSGTSPVIGYTVTVVPAPSPPATITVNGLSASVTGLANGATYTFTVAAMNTAGTGPAALSSPVTVPAAVPDAPTNVVAVASNQSASVTWTAPVNDGGSPVMSYVLAITPLTSAAQITYSGTSANVTGLTNGTSYTFTVAAVNAAGTGPASLPSSPVTPMGAGPLTPTFVQSFAYGAFVPARGVPAASNFTFNVPNTWGAGNCVVVIIDMTHGNSVASLTDDVGNSWPTTPAVSADQGGTSTMLSNVYVLANVTAAGSMFTLNLTKSENNLKMMVLEFAGVATASVVGATSQSHTAKAPTVSAPALSPAAGSLVLHYGLNASSLFGAGNPVTAITEGSGWTLLHADFAGGGGSGSDPSMNWYALQWELAPGGSTIPSFTTTGTSTANTWALELMASPGAGTAPAAGIHINKVQVFTQINITQSPYQVPFPTTGDLTAVIEDQGSLRAVPSDTTGNTWALPVVGANASVSALAYAKNVTPSESNVISFPVSGNNTNTSYFVFDVSGADTTAPLQQSVVFPGAVLGGSWTGTCVITPKKQGSLILNYAGTGIGPIISGTSPALAAFLIVSYPTKTDQDTFDNANAMSTYYNGSSLSKLSFGYVLKASVGTTTITATAAEFH